MSELAALRVEIKNWERQFKAKNDRDPSLQDVKDHPAMTEKYKLYKKLSKAAAAAAVFTDLNRATSSDVPPSTPPRTHQHHPRPSAIRSTKRIIEPTGPLSSFNPFSPVKKKGKQKDIFQCAVVKSDSPSNPLTTPVKANISHLEDAAPSIDPFPPIRPLSSPVIGPKVPIDALSRARKRLRGEPVSPSPSKEKRPRISFHTPLQLPTLSPQSADSNDDENPEHEDGGNSSFVNDSPVKRPAGNKSFKLLFEETVPQQPPPKSRGRLTRSKTASIPTGVIGNSRKTTNDVFSQIAELDERGQGSTMVWKKHVSIRSNNGKQHEIPSSEGNTPDVSTLQHEVPHVPRKRPLSESGTAPTTIAQGNVSVGHFSLLPPSPPPVDSSSSRHKANRNEKGPSKKKTKVIKEIEDGDADGEDEESHAVKLVDKIHEKAHRPNEDDIDPESDPLLFALRRSDVNENSQAIDHTVDIQVHLPERLIHMLAISPPKARDHKEEQLVRKLLHGGRTARYDPQRGGEIWEVGEGGDDSVGDTEDEDDWEGEPVPWEVGEM